MSKKRMKAALYRLGELLAGCVIMSAFICALCVSGPMPVGSIQRDVALALLPVIYVVWNVVMLRRCYRILCRIKIYYIVNSCAGLFFALISICAFFTIPRALYSWMFLATYLAGFSNIGIQPFLSVILFHSVITASIFVAPVGMGWVKKMEEEERQYIENMPPMLEINTVEQSAENTEVVHNEE